MTLYHIGVIVHPSSFRPARMSILDTGRRSVGVFSLLVSFAAVFCPSTSNFVQLR